MNQNKHTPEKNHIIHYVFVHGDVQLVKS